MDRRGGLSLPLLFDSAYVLIATLLPLGLAGISDSFSSCTVETSTFYDNAEIVKSFRIGNIVYDAVTGRELL